MSKLAVDVVILPPDEIMNLSISFNNELLKQVDSELILSKDKCLPHVTIAMGCAEESDIPKISEKLQEIGKRHMPIRLRIRGVEVYELPAKKAISGFSIDRSNELQNLHEDVIAAVKPFYTYDATPEMFLQPPFMDSTGSNWLSGGPYKNILDNYNPHITLGFGKGLQDIEPTDFTATRLALCHLGKSSTCRKILAEYVAK